jgi:GTP1/Obg family GTP-binding protein
MSTVSKADEALDRLLKAEKEWSEHLVRSTFDLKRQMELAQAVKAARDEFVDHLENLCPPFPRQTTP